VLLHVPLDLELLDIVLIGGRHKKLLPFLFDNSFYLNKKNTKWS